MNLSFGLENVAPTYTRTFPGMYLQKPAWDSFSRLSLSLLESGGTECREGGLAVKAGFGKERGSHTHTAGSSVLYLLASPGKLRQGPSLPDGQ